MKRFPWLWLAAMALLGTVVLAAFPARAYLDQQSRRRELVVKVSQVEETAEALRARISELETDEEIERLARERYQLVRPGEEAYLILPAEPVVPEPPAPAVTEPSGGWWSRAWDRVTSVLP